MTDAQLLAVRLGDSTDSWAALGFTVERDDQGARVQIGNTVIELTDSGAGFEGWKIEGIEDALDGLATANTAEAATGAPPVHPNGISSIDHIVISTGDLGRTVAALEAAGLAQRGGRSTDSYGSPMRQVFFWLGDVILELVGPGEGEPTTNGPATMFGVALVAEDLEHTVEALGDLGGEPKDAVQPGRRIAGIRGKETGVSIPLAVMSPHDRD